MAKRFSIFFVWLLVATVRSQAISPADYRALLAETHRSLTGQFTVHSAPQAVNRFTRSNFPTNTIALDPTLLPISCERIKTAVLKAIGAKDQWKGQIFINLHPYRYENEPLTVEPELFGRGWTYRLDLPNHLDRSRLISAIVEIVLLEMADRHFNHSTQIPAWLTQGLTREIQFSTETELVLEAPRTVENGLLVSRLNQSNRRADPLATARADLNTLPPLTIAQLSWPADGQMDGVAGEVYRSSAQFFVHELLRLPNGQAAMRAFVQDLPSHLNWQLTFLQAFHQNFANQLALEKWWALELVQFTGRDLSQNWSSEQSWRKLDEILRPVVEVRTHANELPLRTQASLQAIIRDWDRIPQINLLREKSQQLRLLRLRVSPELVYLVDAYRQVLDNYISKRDNMVYVPVGRTLYSKAVDSFARNALSDLDALDARRQSLRPKPMPHEAANTSISSNN